MSQIKLNIAEQLIKRITLHASLENRKLTESEFDTLDSVRNEIGYDEYEKLAIKIMCDDDFINA